MSVVAPTATPRQIADALNDFSSRFTAGQVTLGAGASTSVTDPRVGPGSFVFLTPVSAAADPGRPVAGDGGFVIEHGSQEGEVVAYLAYTP